MRGSTTKARAEANTRVALVGLECQSPFSIGKEQISSALQSSSPDVTGHSLIKSNTQYSD